MRRIGLLGGMSWESTAVYYRLLNEGVKQRLGGLHSADILLHSVDFAPLEALQHAGDWEEIGRILTGHAQRLEAGGAEGLLICTNTMHKAAPDIASRLGIPLLHIADATGEALTAAGAGRVGLLGTRFTMEEGFYRERLERDYGLEVLLPDAVERELVHRVIYDELCLGVVRETSREAYLAVIEHLAAAGADGVILGCTEIAMLVGGHEAAVPLFDTTRIHAGKALDWMLG